MLASEQPAAKPVVRAGVSIGAEPSGPSIARSGPPISRRRGDPKTSHPEHSHDRFRRLASLWKSQSGLVPIDKLADGIGATSAEILDLLRVPGRPEQFSFSSALDTSTAQAIVELLRPGLARAFRPARTPRRTPSAKARWRGQTGRRAPRPRGNLMLPLSQLVPSSVGSRTCERGRARALAAGRGLAGPAGPSDGAGGSTHASYWTERGLDATRDFWQIRDHGEFGSHSSYDDFSDESAP